MSTLEIILTVISVAGTICAIVFGYKTFARNNRNDETETGMNLGVIMTDLGYIKATLDEIKRQNEKRDDQYIQAVERIAKVEQSAKQAHHRIDNIEAKIKRTDDE